MTVTTAFRARTGQSRNQPMGPVILTAAVAAVLPVLVGLALLLSLNNTRPILSRKPKWWWNPLSKWMDGTSPTVVRTVTIWWAVAFLAVGALQGASAIYANLSITNPVDALVRCAGALALEGAIVLVTIARLRRQAA